MVSKSKIIENLREYSSDQIVGFLRDGTVSMYELKKSGILSPLMRRRIEQKLFGNAGADAPAENGTAEVVNCKGGHSHTADGELESVFVTVNPDSKKRGGVNDIEQNPCNENSSSDQNSTKNEVTIPKNRTNKGMFLRPFSFEGRIRRLEYALSIVILSLVEVIFFVIPAGTDSDVLAALFVFVTPFLCWIYLAQGCKRCHDTGNSGWMQLIPIHPIVLLFEEGNAGDNEYGDCPKD